MMSDKTISRQSNQIKVSGNRRHHRNNHLSSKYLLKSRHSRNELDGADSSKSGKQNKEFSNSYYNYNIIYYIFNIIYR